MRPRRVRVCVRPQAVNAAINGIKIGYTMNREINQVKKKSEGLLLAFFLLSAAARACTRGI